MEKQEVTQRRFYRSNLETIVWNPEEDRPMADFSIGHFTTDDPRIADYLSALGYPEIPLDATEPPNIIVQKPTHDIDGDVPIMMGGIPNPKEELPQTVVEYEQPPVVKKVSADRPTAPPPKKSAKKAKPKKEVSKKLAKKALKKPMPKRVNG